MEFVDRKAAKPNRMLITPEDGTGPFYATMKRADEPVVEGTALSAAVFNEMVAMIQAVDLNATVE